MRTSFCGKEFFQINQAVSAKEKLSNHRDNKFKFIPKKISEKNLQYYNNKRT